MSWLEGSQASKGPFNFSSRESPMDGPQFNDIFQKVANDLLVWVGFGTLAGLFAKAVGAT